MLLAGDEFARTQNGNSNAIARIADRLDGLEGITEGGGALTDSCANRSRCASNFLRWPLRFSTGEPRSELDVKDVAG